ncbi:uncharacterized protein [Pyrus communis]|uniref:uncharacterized protein n=1 Tax=Pyrus communis TaxID=23211 RepID=UPI0035BF66EE
MERDVIDHHRKSFSRCLMSPSCFPVQEEMEYARIRSCSQRKRSPRWRNLLRRLLSDRGRSICGSKTRSFQHDAVSYSQNFDDGCHLHEEPRRHLQVTLPDVRWDGST